jgi:MFS family permease
MLNTGFMNNGLHLIVQGLCELPKQLRWSYLPPLMVYLAAGVSGLTAIVGTFFIKDYLNLSAAFLASLGFWAGLPWALKMPLGHLVDLIWKYKAYLVGLGAAVIAASLLIMFGLIGHTEFMASIMPVEAWFVASVILGPVGYVIQDVVADAMTVEAVPEQDENGDDIDPGQLKTMHTTMQTLGRFAIIGGTVLVSLANVILFSDVDSLDSTARIDLYANIYLYALIIPAISIAGVILARLQHSYHNARIRKLNHTPISAHQRPEINWSILLGSLVFVVFSLSVGTSGIGYAQEIVFAGSVGIILFLMKRLIRFLQPEKRLMIVGTAIIIFTFRAMPSPGPGLTWFEIDQLLFNEQFLSILSLIASILTLVGIILLRPFMANNSIARIIVILSIAGTVLFLPSIGMYYGLHEWTAAYSGGIVDAKFIAIINTAVESPLGQVSMIPLLAWIARNAPAHMKATFFAVFASFTNLALSASALGTKYLNEAFVVTREVKDKISDAIVTTADYSELGMLLITVLLITLVMPIGMVVIIQNSRFKTID